MKDRDNSPDTNEPWYTVLSSVHAPPSHHMCMCVHVIQERTFQRQALRKHIDGPSAAPDRLSISNLASGLFGKG